MPPLVDWAESKIDILCDHLVDYDKCSNLEVTKQKAEDDIFQQQVVLEETEEAARPAMDEDVQKQAVKRQAEATTRL